MYSYDDDTPMAGLQAIFEGARSFGLSEEDAWRIADDVLYALGTDVTIAEYLEVLTGALARGILDTARQTAPSERRRAPEKEPRALSEQEVL